MKNEVIEKGVAKNEGSKEIVELLDREREICSLWIESAKVYTQLSTGALLLSVVFSRDLLGASAGSLIVDGPLVLTWLLWLSAVLVGVTYQYCVIKYLETIVSENGLLYYPRTWRSLVPKRLIDDPFRLYGVMMFLFYGGVTVFSGVAAWRMLTAVP